MRRTLLATLTLPFLAIPNAALAGGGCHEEAPLRPTAATRVAVDGICFGPTVAAVPVGATMTWVNRSGMGHNVTGPAVPYQELPNGGSVTMTFDRPGIHVYACTIHPGMSGAVVVGDVPAAPIDTKPVAARDSGGATGTTGWAVVAVVALAAAAFAATRARGVRRTPQG